MHEDIVLLLASIRRFLGDRLPTSTLGLRLGGPIGGAAPKSSKGLERRQASPIGRWQQQHRGVGRQATLLLRWRNAVWVETVAALHWNPLDPTRRRLGRGHALHACCPDDFNSGGKEIGKFIQESGISMALIFGLAREAFHVGTINIAQALANPGQLHLLARTQEQVSANMTATELDGGGKRLELLQSSARSLARCG